ncbi:hypothetical protein JCM33374_g6509 [Metschnikowia sp. JCM 33374]|nr:hypothetical protein JCM33374_g6509 [Metschnikowia sp. JCM 33374]
MSHSSASSRDTKKRSKSSRNKSGRKNSTCQNATALKSMLQLMDEKKKSNGKMHSTICLPNSRYTPPLPGNIWDYLPTYKPQRTLPDFNLERILQKLVAQEVKPVLDEGVFIKLEVDENCVREDVESDIDQCGVSEEIRTEEYQRVVPTGVKTEGGENCTKKTEEVDFLKSEI